MSNLWLQIKNTKDDLDLGDLIRSIDDSNINEIVDLIPELLTHKSWLIRSDTLDLISDFKLKQFIPNVFEALYNDKNLIVVRDALIAVFDFNRKNALPIVKEHTTHEATSIRLVAWSLLYLESERVEYLEKASKILLRRNCNYLLRYAFFHMMTDYLDVKEHPDVISLLKKVLAATNPEYGVAKDIAKFLREIYKLD